MYHVLYHSLFCFHSFYLAHCLPSLHFPLGNLETILPVECSTMAEYIGAVIRICDYKSVQVLFTPKLQVGTELSQY